MSHIGSQKKPKVSIYEYNVGNIPYHTYNILL
jgi:hypothetical protein